MPTSLAVVAASTRILGAPETLLFYQHLVVVGPQLSRQLAFDAWAWNLCRQCTILCRVA